MSFEGIVDRRTDDDQISITIAHLEHFLLRWATKYWGHCENRFYGHLFTLDPFIVLKTCWSQKGSLNISGISQVP